ncbi:hypothetical protein CPB84DRAFT_1849617 [Gymnopilus junonius]|uniref:Uncharacterized protein n=1 Tax=Gymnopilus junonius TaxID=109634 RepID=A0A9P5NFV3_GYMJU|nr:hypothetical protein CPB84DRAFT_1849617 [Gymnopilus junonius]
MDKATSVTAAFQTGKLPSTQQVNHFINFLVAQVEPSQDQLSGQGRVLVKDVIAVLRAYQQLGANKNSDNILQEAVWHLTEGDLTVAPGGRQSRDRALQDLNAIRDALRNVLNIVWSSVTSEGTSLFEEFFSVARLFLADAAEVVEEQAGRTKDSLRRTEDEVQSGHRDPLGRDKQRLEEENDTQVAWEHKMDTSSKLARRPLALLKARPPLPKRSGIRPLQGSRMRSGKAKSDQEYRQSLDQVFEILQARFDKSVDIAADPNATLADFIADPTPDQHIPKALEQFRSLFERLANTSLEPASSICDQDVKTWFNDSFALARKNLTEPDYARSDESEAKRREMRQRWDGLLNKDAKWKESVDGLNQELDKIATGLANDADLNRVKDAHAKLGQDIQQQFLEAGVDAQMQGAVEQITWFWQDLFKVYIPKLFSKMRDVPIPRTEYKDAEIEFVMENLDISSVNILPSHVYIRNVTDIDINTADTTTKPSTTAVGTLTHVNIKAIQMALKDVSFWYKDKESSGMKPSEFSGLLGLTLPPQGVELDLEVRLIHANARGSESREAKRRFSSVERAHVSLSNDVQIAIKQSNHKVLTTVFKPMVKKRLREALQKTLSEQVEAMVDWADSIAYDVAQRKVVFEDAGLGTGGSLMAAIWSEIGRLQKTGQVDVQMTGTGLVAHHAEKGKSLAMGVEPQILSGGKHGPMAAGAEPIDQKVQRMGEQSGVNPREIAQSGGSTGMDADQSQAVGLAGEIGGRTQGVLREGKKRAAEFERSVDKKKEMEMTTTGWQSSAFDV